MAKDRLKALVIGATGAVGKDLVQQLIEDSSVERVDIFVRRPSSERGTTASAKPSALLFSKPSTPSASSAPGHPCPLKPSPPP